MPVYQAVLAARYPRAAEEPVAAGRQSDRVARISWARVSKEVSTYLLLVLRGLEFLVEEEIRSKLQVRARLSAVN
ncbi:hypothetical protein PF002_g30028, partial [Phytophthora fragariae]